MMKRILGSAAIAVGALLPTVVSAQDVAPMKGGVCFAYSLRANQQGLGCGPLGKFASINELYEKGYRVVSTNMIGEGGGSQTIMIFIEERK